MRVLEVSVIAAGVSVQCTVYRDTGHGPDRLETSILAESSLTAPVHSAGTTYQSTPGKHGPNLLIKQDLLFEGKIGTFW